MVSGDYALGLEPCTADLLDKIEYKTIYKQEKVNFRLSLSLSDL